jgi:small nuclear ribonucleoprotein (snRNP)-like protein
MNIVLDEAVEEKTGGEKVRLGMVVSKPRSHQAGRGPC